MQRERIAYWVEDLLYQSNTKRLVTLLSNADVTKALLRLDAETRSEVLQLMGEKGRLEARVEAVLARIREESEPGART